MRTSSDATIARYVGEGWWGEETLDTLFRAAVEAAPDRLALADPPDRPQFAFGEAQRFSFRELDLTTDHLAAGLYRSGLRQGDRLVVQLPNISELVLVYLAAARLGLIVSPAPIQYGSFELEHIHKMVDASAYVTISQFKDTAFADRQRAAFPDSVPVLVFGPEASAGCTSLALDSPGEMAMQEYLAYVAALEVSANDVFTICWTSGTTGAPKGVPRSFNHWIAQTAVSEDGIGLQHGAVMLNPFPFVNMASIGGFLFLWFRVRASLVLHHPFNAPVFLSQLQDEKVEYTIAAPALLSRLLQQPEVLKQFDLSHLRCIGSGSAPVAADLVEQYKRVLGIDVINIFGSNEGICLMSAPNDVPEPAHRALYFPRFGAAGLSWNNRAGTFLGTRLVDMASGEDIDRPGEPGEMRISGPTVFDGYLNAEEANREVFDEQGYFRTGDLFEIVSDEPSGRFIRFVGRCKDIIVRGGMKISPEELDTVLEGFPGLVEAAVCGYPDNELEERVGVVVVPSDAAPTLEDITAYLADRGVARFKWPERLAAVDELPRNPLNKILRRELVKQFTDQA